MTDPATTRTVTRTVPVPPSPTRIQALSRGAILFLGGLLVVLLIKPVGPQELRWMPLIIGLTYLTASAAGGRSGGLWVPGLMVTCWGISTTTVLSGTIRTDFAAAAIFAIGIGAVLATFLPRFGIPCNPLAIAVIMAAIGALELTQFEFGGVLNDGWPWGAFLAAGGLWELRPGVWRSVRP